MNIMMQLLNTQKEEIEGFYKVRDEFMKHPETGFTVEETHQLVRNKNRK